jgi:hypothetical protein
MVAHHYAVCTSVFGRILCDIELEFQGLCFFCASFLGEAAVRCQVFSKNVDKVIKVKPKRDSVENPLFLASSMELRTFLATAPSTIWMASRLQATSFEKPDENATTQKKSSNRELV